MGDSFPLLVAVAVLLAGCAAPTTPDGAGTDRPDARVDDPVAPDVPVSKNATFERVEGLLGVDGERPPVEVTNLSGRLGAAPTKFQILMGVTETVPGADDAGRFLPERDRVLLNRKIESTRRFETALVHEYVHALQLETGLHPPAPAAESAMTTDDTLTRLALVEGGAVWVTDRYVEGYLPNASLRSSRLVQTYREAPALTRYVLGPHRFGHRYVDGRVDAAADLARVYEDSPATTEQLIHGYGPTEEPPANLSLGVETEPTVRDRRRDTQGELATRVILRSELPAERARAAAEGWGADRLRELSLARPGDDFGAVWALRWDGPADAAEFVAAFEDYAERRREDTTSGYRIVRVSGETVVVVAGPPAFVDRVRASGTAGDVRVTVGDPAS